MKAVSFSLLRGVCQIPAYVAHEKGFFAQQGIESEIRIEPTAWMVPTKLLKGDSQFAVIPWTRVAAGEQNETPMCVLCGSGMEEAAIVLRNGIDPGEVKRISVPLRGGIKDLTAMGLIRSLGWEHAEILRQPSGDGAIIALFGQGVDAASMVEPYATMMEELGVGRIIRRTGDLWKGAPGCCLASTLRMTTEDPDLCERVVRAFVGATSHVQAQPEESAEIAHRYIGVHPRFIHKALLRNPPRNEAILNSESMNRVLELMISLGYLRTMPVGYLNATFLAKTAVLPTPPLVPHH